MTHSHPSPARLTERRKSPVHLRAHTENQIGYAEQFVSFCGVRSYQRREVTRNVQAVTCQKCLEIGKVLK